MSALRIRKINRYLRILCACASLMIAGTAAASEYHGQVTFAGLPVPGATVTATQGNKKIVTISGQDGSYSFDDLPDGNWKIEIAMSCFSTLDQDVTIAPNTPSIKWELKMLPFDQIIAQTKVVKVEPKPVVASEPGATKSATGKPAENRPPEVAKTPEDSSQRPSDGLLINGSVSNAATSQYSMASAFGNTRGGGKGLYNGGLSLYFDNSTFDARPFSLSGASLPKDSYNRVTTLLTLGGPINIPHLIRRGPNFFIAYQWTRNRTATTDSGLVPTEAERSGILSNGTVVPVDPIAKALLALYPLPLPSLAGNPSYNYEVPILSSTHQDALQSRLEKNIGRKDNVYGQTAFQSIRSSGANLFGFVDTTDTLGLNSNINWSHRFNHSFFSSAGYKFSRLRTQITPYFDNRTNVSGTAGIVASPNIGGNNQDPVNWGPPTLNFAGSISNLSDAQSSFNRNRTDALSLSLQLYRGHHNFTFGGDFRREEFNYFAQQDPRGTFGFTGAGATGSDLGDFLSGVPDTSSIAFGNADKYLRHSVYDGFITDDWRIRPELTINIGARWEYGAPMTELKGRLVNLDVAQGFSAVVPVLANDPVGELTGSSYPTSLIRPDKNRIEPRIGISWRPIPGSTLVMRGGYGIYSDTSVYQATALQMAQQSPLSTSFTGNISSCALTLRAGFIPCGKITQNTFAVDPNFRVGYAQTWQLSAQRDLPAAMVGTITYLGIKGTRGVQEFLPNTNPIGAAESCADCPAGFVYRDSNGNSTRESGSVQLRRRLRSGFTATLQYTYSKSIDDDSVLGGQGPVAAGAVAMAAAPAAIAQDWRNLRGERGLSTFDQRHLLNGTIQYTTGMGLGGGTLLGGWRGTLLKEWTMAGQIVKGSGLPETPIYAASVPGTSFTGSIRPDRTADPLYIAGSGHFLNPNAFYAPQAGQWGNAGRNSITGPGTFTFNASLLRTFRIDKRFTLDLHVDATNLLNHVVFTGYNTTLNPVASPPAGNPAANSWLLNNPLFGVPVATNPMRSLQTTLRLRF